MAVVSVVVLLWVTLPLVVPSCATSVVLVVTNLLIMPEAVVSVLELVAPPLLTCGLPTPLPTTFFEKPLLPSATCVLVYTVGGGGLGLGGGE